MNYENVNKIFSTQINVAEIKHSNFIHKLHNQQIVCLDYWAIVVSTLKSLISTFSTATLQKVTSSLSMSVGPIFTFCSWITGSSYKQNTKCQFQLQSNSRVSIVHLFVGLFIFSLQILSIKHLLTIVFLSF